MNINFSTFGAQKGVKITVWQSGSDHWGSNTYSNFRKVGQETAASGVIAQFGLTRADETRTDRVKSMTRLTF